MKQKSTVKKPIRKGVAKVPVVMQLEALECGAASLAMILAYYKKYIPLEQVRLDCGVSRDGASARNVVRAARTYGLTAQGYRFEPNELKRKGTFPCIIHWDFNHFVVLDGFKNNKAYLNDPARGSYSVSMKEFDLSFTGACMMFEPTESFLPSGKPKSVLRFARERLKGTASAVVLVFLTTLITSLISIIKPGFSRVFLDRLLTGRNQTWLYPFIACFSIFVIVDVVANLVKSWLDHRIDGKLAGYGNASFMTKILKLPIAFFSQRMSGDIQMRQDLNASISASLVNTVGPLLLDAITTILYLVVMVRYSPLLATVGLGSMVINIIMSQIIARKNINITRTAMREQGKLAGATVAGIEMIENIKASGSETGFFEKWSGYATNVNTQIFKKTKLNAIFGLLPSLFSSLSSVAVLGIGVYLTILEEFSVGMIMAFQGILQTFMTPAGKLISTIQKIQEMRVEMERIEDVMQYPNDINLENDSIDSNEEKIQYSKLTGNIELKNVTFGYSRLNDPLIKDFNLSIKPGDRIALVGGSGCGKSTLSKLISGLYNPWSGEILFDGKPRKAIDRSVFTGSIAIVDQDIILFEDTISNNIKMWDNSIEDFEVILASRDAQIHDDIMQRDGGYQYKIREGGLDFSGGQRQRMEIARVLAQDPTILILDEATSALDAKTEYNVVSAIQKRGITSIIVAHRLSTIRDCDEIIVLDKGQVVERGTHDELFAKGGLYTSLVTNE